MRGTKLWIRPGPEPRRRKLSWGLETKTNTGRFNKSDGHLSTTRSSRIRVRTMRRRAAVDRRQTKPSTRQSIEQRQDIHLSSELKGTSWSTKVSISLALRVDVEEHVSAHGAQTQAVEPSNTRDDVHEGTRCAQNKLMHITESGEHADGSSKPTRRTESPKTVVDGKGDKDRCSGQRYKDSCSGQQDKSSCNGKEVAVGSVMTNERMDKSSVTAAGDDDTLFKRGQGRPFDRVLSKQNSNRHARQQECRTKSWNY